MRRSPSERPAPARHARFCRWILLPGLLLLGAGLPAAAHSQVAPAPPPDPDHLEPSAECCLVLLLPVGARAVSLGGARTAAASTDGVFLNPAGLAELEAPEFLIHHSALASPATAFSLLLTPARLGAIGVSYQLIDFGDIDLTNEHGHTTGALSLRHHLGVLSLGTRILPGLSAGVNYKLYQFRVGCRGLCGGEETASTVQALDLGVQYQIPGVPSLRVGAAALNAGLRPGSAGPDAEPLPSRFRVGLLYEVLQHVGVDSTLTLTLAIDLEDEWRAFRSPRALFGVEFVTNDMVFLRAGYAPGASLSTGTAVGVGIHYGQFLLSVAKSFTVSALDPSSEPMQVSFGLRF